MLDDQLPAPVTAALTEIPAPDGAALPGRARGRDRLHPAGLLAASTQPGARRSAGGTGGRCRTAFALVAGLNAGAAALHGEIDRQFRTGRPRRRGKPTAAESARLPAWPPPNWWWTAPGCTRSPAPAADVAMSGWQIGLPRRSGRPDRVPRPRPGRDAAGRARAGNPRSGTVRRTGELRGAARREPGPAVSSRDHLHDGPGAGRNPLAGRTTWPASRAEVTVWPGQPVAAISRAHGAGRQTSSGRSTRTEHRSTW